MRWMIEVCVLSFVRIMWSVCIIRRSIDARMRLRMNGREGMRSM